MDDLKLHVFIPGNAYCKGRLVNETYFQTQRPGKRSRQKKHCGEKE